MEHTTLLRSEVMKKIIFMIVAMMILLCGCANKEADIKDKPEVLNTEIVNSDNEELYDCVSTLGGWHDKMNRLWNVRTFEYPEYDYHIGASLVWQLEKNYENSDFLYHVVVHNDTNEEIPEDLIEQIKEENNLDININDWVVLHGWLNVESIHYYYYMFTAEEINALAQNGLWCKYVGSGKGNVKEVNFDTDEGIDVFCELYGDQFSQGK